VELNGYVLVAKRLERLGSGDEASCESMAEMHHEALVSIDGRLRLPEGSSEQSLRAWVMEGRGVGRSARSVLEVLLERTPRQRLTDDAWSPVRAGALEDLDAALQAHGLPRNSGLRKLARSACGAAQRPLVLEDGLLCVLRESDLHAHEAAWASAIARLGLDATRADEHGRALAIQRWWGQTRAEALKQIGRASCRERVS
jgi:hypothetical protein